MRQNVNAARRLLFVFLQLPCLIQLSDNGDVQRWYYVRVGASFVLKVRNPTSVDSSSKLYWIRKTLETNEIRSEEVEGLDRFFLNESHIRIENVKWSDAGIYQRSEYDDAGRIANKSTVLRLVVFNVDCPSTCRDLNTSLTDCLTKCEKISKMDAPEIETKECENQSVDVVGWSLFIGTMALGVIVAVVVYIYRRRRRRERMARSTGSAELGPLAPRPESNDDGTLVKENEVVAAPVTQPNSHRSYGKDFSSEWQRCGRIYVKDEDEVLRGVAFLRQTIYVVYKSSKFIDVHDRSSIDESTVVQQPSDRKHTEPVNRVEISKVKDPYDLATCQLNNRLYLSDRDGNTIWCFDIGKDPKKPQGRQRFAEPQHRPLKLSTTPEGNLCVLYPDRVIKVFSPDGELKVEVEMPDAGLTPSHACTAGENSEYFFVAHFDHFASSKEQHRVCLVNEDGSIQKEFGGRPGNGVGETNCPGHIVPDGAGGVFVGEWDNDRIINLDKGLSEEQKVIFRGCVRPRRLAYSVAEKLLVIGTYHDGIYLCQPPKGKRKISLYGEIDTSGTPPTGDFDQ